MTGPVGCSNCKFIRLLRRRVRIVGGIVISSALAVFALIVRLKRVIVFTGIVGFGAFDGAALKFVMTPQND